MEKIKRASEGIHKKAKLYRSKALVRARSLYTKIRASKKLQVVSALVLLVIVLGFFVGKWFLYDRPGALFVVGEYTTIDSIVASSYSQSAQIALTLPEDFAPIKNEDGSLDIKILPLTRGEWAVDGDRYLFTPAKKLKTRKVYTITVGTQKGKVGKEFYVEDDPRVSSVLPDDRGEASEKSEISITFTRPMVAFGRTGRIESGKMQGVRITPETPGYFQWAGTSTLQFIPEAELVQASDYTVEIDDTFTSYDGVSIDPHTTKFTTRHLRLHRTSSGSHKASLPVTYTFNQRVDIDSVRDALTVTTTGEEEAHISVVVEYGMDAEGAEQKDIIYIFQEKDRYGRERLWDANTNYQFELKRALPERGTYGINEAKKTKISVGGVIERSYAKSQRSQYADPKFFDPQGELFIEFTEQIDISASQFSHPQIGSVSYAKTCEPVFRENHKGEEVEATTYPGNSDCVEVDDQQTARITFDGLNRGSDSSVSIGRLVNTDGVTLSSDNLAVDIKTVPLLTGRIESGTDVQEMSICTSVPLERGIAPDLTASQEIRFGQVYSNSHPKTDAKGSCDTGEFVTNIRYKVLPESDYNFAYRAKDKYGQEQTIEGSFKTGAIKSYNKQITSFNNSYSHNYAMPDQAKLTYSLLNIDYADIHICKVAARDYLEQLVKDDRSASPKCTEEKIVKKEVERGVYWDPVQFTLDMQEIFEDVRGYYVLTLTHPEYVGYKGEKRETKTKLAVSDFASVQKIVKPEAEMIKADDANKPKNIFWVFASKDLAPVQNAEITMYKSDGKSGSSRKIEEGDRIRTDANGLVEQDAFFGYVGGILEHQGQEVIVGIDDDAFGYARNAVSRKKAYLYADRPIYRPGHEVHIRGLLRAGFDGQYSFEEKQNVVLQVMDSAQEVIHKQEVEISAFGTVSTSLTIPENAPLGDYTIETMGVYAGSAKFDVQEYVSSPFKAEIAASKEEFLAGENLDLTFDAEYYFGAPVTGGEVEYAIATQDYHFDRFEDASFSFDRGWYGCYFSCEYGDTFITRKTVDLGRDGTLNVSEPINFDEWFTQGNRDKSVIATVYATMKSASGQSVSTQKSFIVHRGAYYLGIKTDKYYTSKGGEVGLTVKSVDKDGKQRSVSGLEMKVSKIEWKANRRREVDGGYYYNSQKVETVVSSQSVATDSSGTWQGSESFPESGQYEIVVSGRDASGNIINEQTSVYVGGNDYVSGRKTNNTELEIDADQKSVEVGDQARVLFISPYENAKALVTLERGRVHEHHVIDVNGSIGSYAFDMTQEHVPNIYASVTLVSGGGEIKHGQTQFFVDRKENELTIEVEASKQQYLPGEEVELNVSVKDSSGNPAAAEVSLAVVDLSVLALKGNPQKNPLLFFYDGFPLTVATGSNLRNKLADLDVEESTKGGGGGDPDDLEKRRRGEFRDTALWKNDLVTDSSGQATITFTLPDNLTTWQVESLGITSDTKVGVDYEEFVARKDVLVTPIAPRFVVPGDQFLLGAHVFNQTSEEVRLSVGVGATELEQGDTSKKEVVLTPKSSELVYFDMQAPYEKSEGKHVYELSVEGKGVETGKQYIDRVQKKISVTQDSTQEAIATAGTIHGNTGAEAVYVDENIDADKGDITVRHSATLGVFTRDALEYLITYPYGCSEQIASKLKALAYVEKARHLDKKRSEEITTVTYKDEEIVLREAIENGLSELLTKQSASGGFGYFSSHNKNNYYLTLYVTQTLQELVDAGYDIPQSVLTRAYYYISQNFESEMVDYRDERRRSDHYIFTAAVLARGDAIKKGDAIHERILDISKNEKYLSDEISSLALAQLAYTLGVKEKIFSGKTVDRVFAALENRIQIDARGAYLPTQKDYIVYRYYETTTNDTALAIKAFVAAQRDYIHMDKMLRWLLRSRNAQGVWETTNTTGNVIDAMQGYIGWKGEDKSVFDLTVKAAGKKVDEFSYKKDTIFAQNEVVLPLKDFTPGTLSSITFQKDAKENQVNTLYYDLQMRYGFPIEDIRAKDEGFTITNQFYTLEDEARQNPIQSANRGEIIRGRVQIIAPNIRSLVGVEAYLPAGLTAINTDLATEYLSLIPGEEETTDFYTYENNVQSEREFPASHKEFRDDRVFLFAERLNAGTYTFDYLARAGVPGTFTQLPAVVSEMYFPETYGRTRAKTFTVNIPE